LYTDGGNQGNVQGRTWVIIKATIPSALLNLVKLAWRWSGGIGTRYFFLCTRIIYIGTHTSKCVTQISTLRVYINSINIVHWKLVVYIGDVTDPFFIIQISWSIRITPKDMDILETTLGCEFAHELLVVAANSVFVSYTYVRLKVSDGGKFKAPSARRRATIEIRDIYETTVLRGKFVI